MPSKTHLSVLFLALCISSTSEATSIPAITDCVTKSTGTKLCSFPEIDINESTIALRFEGQDSVIYCVRTEQRDPNHWHGECYGSDNDANFVRTPNTEGAASIFGSIHIGDDSCQIAPNSLGDLEIECNPYSSFEDEWEADDLEDEDDDRNLVATDAVFAMSKSNNLRRRLQTDYDDGKTLDIMVVWTKSAECGYSGLAYPCELTSATEAKMRGLVTLAVSVTDDAFALSGIDAKIRVVHAYRHETYEEPSSNSWNTMVKQLRTGNDGHMDDVHGKRALYGADLVHLISGARGSCGVGFVGPTKDKMFSASRYTCAVANFSFGHELAHNLGAHHDRGTLNRCDVTSAHNFGYKDPQSEFRSIMAYDCQTTQCDGLPKRGCPRVQRFSNQAHQYNLKPIGDYSNDNASVITNGINVASGFFPAMNCQHNSECDDNDPSTINTCNVSNNVCVFTKRVVITEPPSPSPTTDLSQYNNLGFLETVVVPSVSTTSWKSVSLSSSFTDPVATCSVKYDGATSLLPTVVRMRNVSGSSFQVKLQNPSGSTSSIAPRTLHCLLVERGVWRLPDGRPIEAAKIQSTVTDYNLSWAGQRQSFEQEYDTPVVLGQVMTYNDARWSTFWTRGKDTNSCADADDFFVGKHVGEDSVQTRSTETIGYIVMEASHGEFSSVEFDAGQSHPFVAGYVQGNYQVSFGSTFGSGSPDVTLVSQCAMAGADGAWPVLTTSSSNSAFGVAVDEDQMKDGERTHAPEALNFMAFSVQGSMPLVPLGGPSAPPPVEEGSGPMQSILVPNVDSTTWVTVPLSGSFTSPIAVCTVKYDSGTSLLPASVRMQNVQSSSFQIRLQNPSGATISGRDVHCVAAEKGVWTLPDGRKMEAFEYTSTRTDAYPNWVGEAQTFSHDYAVPVILGQVTTFNDDRFVSFWSRGATRFAHAETGGAFFTGKQRGSVPGWEREDETIGVIVMDAGHQHNGSADFEAGRGSTAALGYVSGNYINDFMEPFDSSPAVTVLSVPMMVGVDGCWPVLTSDATSSSFGAAVDEDQAGDAERTHAAEYLDYVAFAVEGTVQLSPSN